MENLSKGYSLFGKFKFRVWDCLSKKMLGWGVIFHLPAWEPGTPEQRAFVVMQHIGLEDSTGEEIYEGDIIKLPDFLDERKTTTGVVKYNVDNAMFILDLGDDVEQTFYTKDKMTIIGNIYENPELWEEK